MLMDVYCRATDIPQADFNSFEDATLNKATLHVPAESLDMYKSTDPWSRFASIVALTDEELAIIGVGATGNVLVNASAGVITISGIKDGEDCCLYSLSGAKLDHAVVANGSAQLDAKGESMVVLRIGSQSIKVMMK